MSAYKLEEHSQQGLVKDGNHLGGSRGVSSKQIRMASECDSPMHPLGCGLNQGQGTWSICTYKSHWLLKQELKVLVYATVVFMYKASM